MRRVLVGFAVLCLITVTAGVTASAPAGAGVPGFTSVFTANAYSYGAGNLFDSAFCVNGTLVSNPTTEQVTGPYSLASGAATVDFFDSDSIDCETDDPTASADVVFPDQGTVTLMGYWGFDGVRGVSMLVDPLECIEAGMGRLTVRNGADVNGGSGAVDIYGEGPGGTVELLMSDIAAGEQGTVDLPVGSYTNITATPTGDPDPVASIDDIEVLANSSAFAYLYGGNDGDVGSFLGNPEELDTCAVATTTTTAPPAAAPAVEAQPAFTG